MFYVLIHFENQENIISVIIHGIVSTLDMIITCFIMYLMIERNNKDYLKFIKILYKLKICCCLNRLIINSIQFMPERDELFENNQANDNKEKTKISVYETGDNTIHIEQVRYVDQSEMTMTKNAAQNLS